MPKPPSLGNLPIETYFHDFPGSPRPWEAWVWGMCGFGRTEIDAMLNLRQRLEIETECNIG